MVVIAEQAQYRAELAALSAQYGAPLYRMVELPSAAFNPLAKGTRQGEVCMVVRRPQGCLITARKTFYPAEAYRLLTGGIDEGEPIAAALLRETDEETGLEVVVRRFLAHLDYRVAAAPGDEPRQLTFSTFAFLLDEVGGTLAPRDEHERLAGYRCVMPHELPALATFFETIMPDAEISPATHERHREIGELRAWGIFRAAAHRAVYDALLEF